MTELALFDLPAGAVRPRPARVREIRISQDDRDHEDGLCDDPDCGPCVEAIDEIEAIEIALETRCVDCGIYTLPQHTPIGAQDWHQFMVHDEVWAAAGLGHGWICLPCLEARLGRPLVAADLTEAPINYPGTYDDFPRLAELKAEAAAIWGTQSGRGNP